MPDYFGRNEPRLAILRSLFHGGDQEALRTKGFRSVDQAWNTDLSRAVDSMGTYTVTIDPDILALFEAFIQECASSGIGLVLVDPPQYVEGQEFYADRVAVMDLYKALARKHGLPYLDHSNDTISTMRDLYYNSNHLNTQGSKVFSRKLARDLLPILNAPAPDSTSRSPIGS